MNLIDKYKNYFLHVNLHWIFWLNISYILGLASYFKQSAIPGLATIILLIILHKYINFYKKILIALAFIFAIINTQYLENNYKNSFVKMDNQNVSITAKVINKQENKNSNFKSIATVKIEAPALLKNKCVIINSMWENNFLPGDIVKIDNLKFRMIKNQNKYRKLLAENIFTKQFIIKSDYKIIYRPKYSIRRFVYNNINRVKQTLKNKMSERAQAFFNSIFWGSTDKNQQFKISFQNWGISHYASKSGLHFMIIIFFILMLLRLIPISLNIKYLFLIFFSIIYYSMTSVSASFAKAISNFIIYSVFIITERQFDAINVLTLVCLANLIYNPFQILFLNFQFTFLISFCITYFYQLKRIRKNY